MFDLIYSHFFFQTPQSRYRVIIYAAKNGLRMPRAPPPTHRGYAKIKDSIANEFHGSIRLPDALSPSLLYSQFLCLYLIINYILYILIQMALATPRLVLSHITSHIPCLPLTSSGLLSVFVFFSSPLSQAKKN